MTLAELRQARELTQVNLGETLHVGQAAGELDIVARFPDGDVKISNFAEMGEKVG